MTALVACPFSLTTCRAYGSTRVSVPPAAVIRIWYAWPGRAPGTSADHRPVPPASPASGVPVADQDVKSPVTAAPSAFGAHTRNVVPPPYGTAPIPARLEGSVATGPPFPSPAPVNPPR